MIIIGGNVTSSRFRNERDEATPPPRTTRPRLAPSRGRDGEGGATSGAT